MSHADPNPPFGSHPGQPYRANPHMMGGQAPVGWGLASAHAPQPVPRRRRRWPSYGATALAALIVGIGIGSSGGAETPEAAIGVQATVTVTEPAPTITVTETAGGGAEDAQDAGPVTTVAGDGQYLVGEDIKPGTYKTAGTARDYPCYWARLKDASGELSAIITNDNITGPTRVTVKKGEYFETKGCREWRRVG
mgnify:CR=1 FL=1